MDDVATCGSAGFAHDPTDLGQRANGDALAQDRGEIGDVDRGLRPVSRPQQAVPVEGAEPARHSGAVLVQSAGVGVGFRVEVRGVGLRIRGLTTLAGQPGHLSPHTCRHRMLTGQTSGTQIRPDLLVVPRDLPCAQIGVTTFPIRGVRRLDEQAQPAVAAAAHPRDADHVDSGIAEHLVHPVLVDHYAPAGSPDEVGAPTRHRGPAVVERDDHSRTPVARCRARRVMLRRTCVANRAP